MSHKIPEELMDFRRRLWLIGRFVNTTFGRFAKYDPTIWRQGAFMMLVSKVVDVLSNQKEVSVEDLVKLSKVLSEANRLNAKPRGSTKNGKSKNDPAGQTLSEADLGPIIRELYGINMEEIEAAPD
jgi:hypothetical protein